MKICVGIDVGSVAVKLAACGTTDNPLVAVPTSGKAAKAFFFAQADGNQLLLSHSSRTRGEPVETARTLLDEFRNTFEHLEIVGLRITGSGGNAFSTLLDAPFENSFKAIAQAAGTLYPDVQTVLELGGETARYMRIDASSQRLVRVVDYEKNGDCAAGTGAFIEQQAARLKYSLEEVGEAVLQAEKAALIAGRCSVFAKTDMVHAQQKGYNPPAILRGLCEAVMRNFKSSVCKGKQIFPKVLFAGGLALNKGVVAALRQVFELDGESLIIPPFPASMGAIGCALIERNRQGARTSESVPERQIIAARCGPYAVNTAKPVNAGRLPTLSTDNVLFLRDRIVPYSFEGKELPVDVYLGIDVGSVSTNLVLVDDDDNLIKEIYVRTEGRPIEVVNRGLRDIEEELGFRIRVCAAGTTGSGRELIGALVGADTINDEITAHKTGALYISGRLQEQKVDTIFEVGGQDSKFISIEDGVVVDFSMNEACAAGTGSFLEEQAERLGISIVKEFSALAFASAAPVQFGERCTVFIESDINTHIHQGAEKADIVAGLAYSIALNYLNRVVRGRKIGGVIYFQGGTAYNDAVAAAFAMLLKKRIIVPPHNGVLGAVGMAILAREKVRSKRQRGAPVHSSTSFRGFRLDVTSYSTHQFTCKACSNYCEIQQVRVGEEKTYWGDKCSDKFRKNTKMDRKATIPDLLAFREKLLVENCSQDGDGSKPRIGIPRALTFYTRFPFFNAYLTELGFQVVLSDPSNREVVDAGVEATAVEPCFPVKLANGHILNLLRKNVEHVLVPNIIDAEMDNSPLTPYACPWTITLPFVALCQAAFERARDRFLIPTLHFSRGTEGVKKELASFARTLEVSSAESNRAAEYAFEAQRRFWATLGSKGAEVLDALRGIKEQAIVIVGRAYNVYDRTVNLNLAGKLRDYYGINVVPFDFFDLEQFDVHTVHENMYWHCGKQILQAALALRKLPLAHIIYITNFKCGPDSYVKHYVAEASGKSFLTLQFDGHSNDAGMVTRCEAYLHSKGFLT
ncbi:MAG: acyl-CoA dehydratase activase [Ignavibacteriales bacterium]|nr:acyl-CoA dehydratase activase [Ignavibacteriales bacterium]